jgi:hypothetical protein
LFSPDQNGGIEQGAIGLDPITIVDLSGITNQIDATKQEFNMLPAPQTIFFAADDVLPVIGALRDEIAGLRALVDDMRKGNPVL